MIADYNPLGCIANLSDHMDTAKGAKVMSVAQDVRSVTRGKMLIRGRPTDPVGDSATTPGRPTGKLPAPTPVIDLLRTCCGSCYGPVIFPVISSQYNGKLSQAAGIRVFFGPTSTMAAEKKRDSPC